MTLGRFLCQNPSLQDAYIWNCGQTEASAKQSLKQIFKILIRINSEKSSKISDGIPLILKEFKCEIATSIVFGITVMLVLLSKK